MKIKQIIFYLFLLLILLLGLSFAALNATPVSIDYYLEKREVPLSLLLVYALGLGVIFGVLTTLMSLFKLKRENHALKKTIKKLSTTPSLPEQKMEIQKSI